MTTATQAKATYVDDNDHEKRDRRLRDRGGDDERIEHLFNGFDSRIESVELNDDGYSAGYLRAMRLEFGLLIASLAR